MSTYAPISIIALFCYLLLLMAFLASKKTRLIKDFIFLLVVLTAWTLGSLGLRLQLFGQPTLWFYLSINALFLLSYAYYRFICSYTGARTGKLNLVWMLGSVVIIMVNMVMKGIFIGVPDIQLVNGETVFVYSTSWIILLPLAFCALIVVHCTILILKYSRETEISRQQILPIAVGMFLLFAGNALASLPFFSSFPIDILSGVANAVMIFWALYQRHLFRLTLLVSRSICYMISAVFSILVFTYVVTNYERQIVRMLGVFGKYYVIIIAVGYLLVVLGINFLVKRFVDHVFIKNELVQADNLRDFSQKISKTLDMNEILGELTGIIEETLHTEKVYICLQDNESGAYRVAQSSSPLDKRSIILDADNPLVIWMARNKECILYSQLKKLPIYRAMWDKEKQLMQQMQIECLLPLVDEETLIGLVMMSGKVKGGHYSVQDQTYLQQLASMSSMAVKNANMYEKAYREARTDSLTGLLNRNYFLETINNEFEKSKGKELTLIFVSLDDFGLFNQLYGSQEGDLALQKVARIIAATVGNNGYVARYEGKIYGVILPEYDTRMAYNMAETIRTQIKDMNSRSKDYAIKSLTCCCGICTVPHGASNVRQLISNANLAVYNAKRNGKNCTRSYSEGIVETPVGSQTHDSKKYKADVYQEYAATVYALTAAIDAKDHYTFQHSQNVCYYAMALAEAYGQDEDCVEIVKEAALLHDIGKIGVPENILRKQGRLTEEEFGVIQKHVEQSISIIRYLPSLDYVIPAVLGHHERYDGSGYPRGLKGEEIPLQARILCVADSFDAMMSKRSYKDPYTLDYAINQLETCSNKQFDPKLAAVFIGLLKSGKLEIRRSSIDVE